MELHQTIIWTITDLQWPCTLTDCKWINTCNARLLPFVFNPAHDTGSAEVPELAIERPLTCCKWAPIDFDRWCWSTLTPLCWHRLDNVSQTKHDMQQLRNNYHTPTLYDKGDWTWLVSWQLTWVWPWQLATRPCLHSVWFDIDVSLSLNATCYAPSISNLLRRSCRVRPAT